MGRVTKKRALHAKISLYHTLLPWVCCDAGTCLMCYFKGVKSGTNDGRPHDNPRKNQDEDSYWNSHRNNIEHSGSILQAGYEYILPHLHIGAAPATSKKRPLQRPWRDKMFPHQIPDACPGSERMGPSAVLLSIHTPRENGGGDTA